MNKIKKFLINLLEYVRHKKSYAQDGEDVVLASFYEEQKNYRGFFVDVGAHHPVRFSNTWMFYRKGWRGINIDPTPGSMRPFRWLRSGDTNLEIGIGQEAATMRFYCFNDPALNTFDPEVAKKRDTGRPYRVIKTVDVPILPLRAVFEQHLKPSQVIDFMTIDVEGLDLQVLQSNDWGRFRPRYLLVEDVTFDPNQPQEADIYQYLKTVRYHLVASMKRTLVYQDAAR
jgi:FkbM family methyltransferase